jgi:hypothetical protein
MKYLFALLICSFSAVLYAGDNPIKFPIGISTTATETTTTVCVPKAHAYQYPYVPVCYTKEPEITWVGLVAVGSGDEYLGNVGWLSEVEIGLRDDGVLVWRKKGK